MKITRFAQKKPPFVNDDELSAALRRMKDDLAHLKTLRNRIVRRRCNPEGWSEEFDGLLLGLQCSIDMLQQQIDHYWPAPPPS